MLEIKKTQIAIRSDVCKQRAESAGDKRHDCERDEFVDIAIYHGLMMEEYKHGDEAEVLDAEIVDTEKEREALWKERTDAVERLIDLMMKRDMMDPVWVAAEGRLTGKGGDDHRCGIL